MRCWRGFKAARPTKAIVAVIMMAHTVQYQSEPRTVMAIWAWALLTASSVIDVRAASACSWHAWNRTIDLKSLVTHISECFDIQRSRSGNLQRTVGEEGWRTDDF